MWVGGILLVAGALCAVAGCSSGKADPQAQPDDVALATVGQADNVPEDASTEELRAILDKKVEDGVIPKERAEKLLKVLESANDHNERLQRMDDQLFGEDAL